MDATAQAPTPGTAASPPNRFACGVVNGISAGRSRLVLALTQQQSPPPSRQATQPGPWRLDAIAIALRISPDRPPHASEQPCRRHSFVIAGIVRSGAALSGNSLQRLALTSCRNLATDSRCRRTPFTSTCRTRREQSEHILVNAGSFDAGPVGDQRPLGKIGDFFLVLADSAQLPQRVSESVDATVIMTSPLRCVIVDGSKKDVSPPITGVRTSQLLPTPRFFGSCDLVELPCHGGGRTMTSASGTASYAPFCTAVPFMGIAAGGLFAIADEK